MRCVHHRVTKEAEDSQRLRPVKSQEYPQHELTEQIIGAAMEVHKAVGPGLLESAYQAFFAEELKERGIRFAREASIPTRYKTVVVDCGYRLDFLIEDAVIVELKAVERIEPIHEAQLLTCLKITGKRVGLLLNFNVPLLKQGIVRRIN